MKDFFFLVLGLLIIASSVILFLNNPRTTGREEGTLKIVDTEIKVEIADTDAERSLGLSGRDSLKTGYGMLFVFDTPGSYGFWMKDMKFSIDIIWIDADGRVIGVEKGVEPETYPKVFYPPTPAKYVLEVPAGFADLHQVTPGSVVQ